MSSEPAVTLRSLLEEDQADRRAGQVAGLGERDAHRRRLAEKLLAEGEARSGEDHWAAAMLFQHGGSLQDIRRAHELAKRAVELGCARAKWLVAASLDRWLMYQGKPQKFGTQYRPEAGRWVLWRVDPSTTDEERAALNVPPLSVSMEQAETMSRKSPPA